MNNINSKKNNLGFTLIEIMIAIAIIGILAAIALPNYERYVIKTKRGIMMSELQGLASKISKQKVIQGSYRNIEESAIFGGSGATSNQFPQSEKVKLYSVELEPIAIIDNKAKLTSQQWTLTATPITGTIMDGDGILSLDYTGRKCHKTKCGMGDEWK
ncbi:MAG: prepilin-type N-terminal cleavage/methylation domain-containing protein [Moraxellaceae bacterium]|nr:prepilin-type N-terminal cleavage/methylation domain-containing protein [Moraxellaceae bacterium]